MNQILFFLKPMQNVQAWLPSERLTTHDKNATVPMLKSRALLGSISDVERARVMDLQNPEPDRPLAAHFRVPWCFFVFVLWAFSIKIALFHYFIPTRPDKNSTDIL